MGRQGAEKAALDPSASGKKIKGEKEHLLLTTQGVLMRAAGYWGNAVSA